MFVNSKDDIENRVDYEEFLRGPVRNLVFEAAQTANVKERGMNDDFAKALIELTRANGMEGVLKQTVRYEHLITPFMDRMAKQDFSSHINYVETFKNECPPEVMKYAVPSSFKKNDLMPIAFLETFAHARRPPNAKASYFEMIMTDIEEYCPERMRELLDLMGVAMMKETARKTRNRTKGYLAFAKYCERMRMAAKNMGDKPGSLLLSLAVDNFVGLLLVFFMCLL
jgi:hypothetical protein